MINFSHKNISRYCFSGAILAIISGGLTWSGVAQTPVGTGQTRSVPPVRVDQAVQPQLPQMTAAQLVQQGKGLYRAVRLKEALDKFVEALKLEPDHDEALGLAAVTSFRLDQQSAARDYFQRRADLAGQKDTVRAFCHYRIALTYWREVHDLIAKYSMIENGRLVYHIPDSQATEIDRLIIEGMSSVDRTLAQVDNFAEAHSTRSLLQAEAAIVATDPASIASLRQSSLASLKRAIELTEQAAAAGKKSDVADFSQPTVRISEFPRTVEEESTISDPILKLLEGGRPIKRHQPVFPVQKTVKTEIPEVGAAVASDSGSHIVKVEILVSTLGDVAYASVIEGRQELRPAALLAARGWKFEPARFEGHPVQISGSITFEVRSAKGR